MSSRGRKVVACLAAILLLTTTLNCRCRASQMPAAHRSCCDRHPPKPQKTTHDCPHCQGVTPTQASNLGSLPAPDDHAPLPMIANAALPGAGGVALFMEPLTPTHPASSRVATLVGLRL